jgi:hypothetical protein
MEQGGKCGVLGIEGSSRAAAGAVVIMAVVI